VSLAEDSEMKRNFQVNFMEA